jgi:hypothetical protein
MPKGYEKRRDQLIRQGYTKKAAQKRAAREYNARLKPGQKPVGRKTH